MAGAWKSAFAAFLKFVRAHKLRGAPESRLPGAATRGPPSGRRGRRHRRVAGAVAVFSRGCARGDSAMARAVSSHSPSAWPSSRLWRLPAAATARARGALPPVLTHAAAELLALLLLATLALVPITMAPTVGAGSRPSRSACSRCRSLGLTAAPVPFAAAALGQLWQLAIAEFRDGLAMWGCQSADFQGLSRLQNICIRLRSPRADLAAVRLALWRSAVAGAGARGLNRGPAPVGLGPPPALPGCAERFTLREPGAAFTPFLSPALTPCTGRLR
jgi:hypothetical protein